MSGPPPFAVERFHMLDEQGGYDMLKVVCGRADCGEEFWVKPKWRIPLTPGIKTRPCPNCWRVGLVPLAKAPRRKS